MKKGAVIIIALLLALGIAGGLGYYFLSDNLSLVSKDITSSDGKYSMSVPMIWKEAGTSGANTVLSAENSDSSEYATMTVDSESFSDGQSVEEYVYSYIDKIAQRSDNPLVQVTSVAPQEVKLGGNTGYYFELDTSAGNVSLHTWDFVYTSNGGYVHVDVAAKGDSQDNCKRIAQSIIESASVN